MNSNKIFHILLIEDNAGDAELTRLNLKDSSLRHIFYHVSTLFEGIQLLAQKPIDLVLLDLSLPDSTDFKTLNSFLKKCPQVPVIILTGTNNELIGNQAVKAGAMDYLIKGHFDSKLLGRAIRYALHRVKTRRELEQSTKALANSEKRFLEAQRMAQFGNWEMNIVNNQMTWTDEIYRIFGFTPQSISPSLSDYILYTHPEDKKEVKDFFSHISSDGKVHHLVHRIIINGTSIKTVRIQAKVNFDEIQNKVLLVGVLQDISREKLTEKLIIEKNISQESAKMKNAALSDLSFHIRTPLSSVINLTYLLNEGDSNPEQSELLEDLKTSVEDLSVMVNNLLNFTLLASDKTETDKELIITKNFFSGLRRVAKFRVENAALKLNFDLKEPFPKKILSDANKITQIFYNVLEYLISKMTQNKTLNIEVDFRSKNGSPTLIMALQGIGFSLDVLEKKEIFQAEQLLEIYQPEPSEQQNQLLGLAIVHKLSSSLNCILDIQDKADGSVFEIQIPIKRAKESIQVGGEKPTGPLKILLVEDHFLNQIATKKLLKNWSPFVEVLIADNGKEGLEKFKKENVDIVLMDLQMPIMNGMEASQEIRKKSNVPIIALTANSSKPEEEKCLSIGMNAYLSKPFNPEELYDKIMCTLLPWEFNS